MNYIYGSCMDDVELSSSRLRWPTDCRWLTFERYKGTIKIALTCLEWRLKALARNGKRIKTYRERPRQTDTDTERDR